MELLPGFKQFWKICPKKQAKGAAYREWIKQSLEDKADEVIEGTKRHQFTDDPMYIKLPANYLRDWCWLDEGVTNNNEDKALKDALRGL